MIYTGNIQMLQQQRILNHQLKSTEIQSATNSGKLLGLLKSVYQQCSSILLKRFAKALKCPCDATNLLGHHITLKLVRFKSHLSFHMRVVCNLLDITLVLFAP